MLLHCPIAVIRTSKRTIGNIQQGILINVLQILFRVPVNQVPDKQWVL